MKLLLLSFLIPVATQAASPSFVTCTLKNPMACKNCEERIPASCEENSYLGSFEDFKQWGFPSLLKP